MIIRICPSQILKNTQCRHFLKTILSIVNRLISRVKIHVQRKIISFNLQCYQHNDDIILQLTVFGYLIRIIDIE